MGKCCGPWSSLEGRRHRKTISQIRTGDGEDGNPVVTMIGPNS
jgi:hypothetical protein